MVCPAGYPTLPGPPSSGVGEDMEQGWIKLHRKARHSQVFKNPYLWQIWSWCLMEATHTELWIPVKTGRGITEVHLLPGQFIFGRGSAAEKLEMNPSSLWKRMLKLKELGNLKIESNSKYSVITLANWGLYQDGPEKVTGKEQRKMEKSDSESGSENSRQGQGLRGIGDSESGSEKSKKVTQTRSKVSKDTCRQQANPDVKTFIKEWSENWFQRFNKPYTVNWGKEGRLVKDMLKIHNLQELRELRKEFFQSQDSFIKKSDYSLGIFKYKLNKLITTRKGDEPMRDYIGQPLE